MLEVKVFISNDYVQVSAFHSRMPFCLLLVGHARRDGRDQPYGRIYHIGNLSFSPYKRLPTYLPTCVCMHI